MKPRYCVLLILLPALLLLPSESFTQVKPYKVSPALTEVINFRHFARRSPVTPAKKAALAKDLVVVTPGRTKQLFQVYEDNDYKDIPSFVTTDAFLHLYHIFFDFTLRNVEEQRLLPVLERLTNGMLADSIATYRSTSDQPLKQAALKNVVYFGVAASQLGSKPEIPPEARSLLRMELDLIARHEGRAVGVIFPYEVDYSQFVPRGHYTRSEALKRYFTTMMWYGLAPFALRSNLGRADETIRQSVLLTRSLYRAKLTADWDTIYEPTTFYVGASDDITPSEWNAAMERVYGAGADLDSFADAQRFEKFISEVEKLRPASIQERRLIQPGKTAAADPTIQMRFMGQRYIPDSEILQKLSVPIKRVFPSGLDVMGVLGSERAISILDADPALYNPKNWEQYKSERGKLVDQFAKIPSDRWTSNLYWSWLYCLKALIDSPTPGSPSFMQGNAWRDKSLNSSLASWAQLRHDTILYGKQSGAESGDGSEPAPYRGYVEPNVKFWSRLLDLLKRSHEGLRSRGLLPDEMEDKFGSFEETVETMKTIAEKEMRAEPLTEDEYEAIRGIGGTLEYMTLSVMSGQPDTWELVNEADKDMACIADVHTGDDKALEEAVGRANEILVIVPVEGKLVLTRGAVFSYYEFLQPASDRLTDEKWQRMLNLGRGPAPPAWTSTFILSPATAARPR